VQLPLPNNLDFQYVVNTISREKDTDVLGERALGAFYAGRNPALPPAVGVLEEILKLQNVDFKNSRVVIIGRGALIGRPIALWLLNKVKELTIFGRGGDFGVLKNADIVISGVGHARLIAAEMLAPHAAIIDFGYSSVAGEDGKSKLTGDFDPAGFNGWYTPTPGGTGPILVAKLFENFYKLNSK